MSIFLSSKADRREIQALQKCRNPENADLLALFKSKLEETKLSLVEADDAVRIHRLQGRAQVLKDFLEAVEKSSSIRSG
jgi:hypothetical protein